MVYVIPNENLNIAKTKPKHVKSEENIFNSLKFVMIFFQIFGVLPQENIMSSQNELHFKWKSWKVLYTLFLVGMTTFVTILCVLDWFYVGYDFASLGNVLIKICVNDILAWSNET